MSPAVPRNVWACKGLRGVRMLETVAPMASGVLELWEGGVGKQREPCTSDSAMPAFYSVVQRSQGMSLANQN